MTFYSSCSKNGAELVLSTTGMTYVKINNKWILTEGHPYPDLHKVFIQPDDLKCGCNILEIFVFSCHYPSPGAVNFKLTYDDTNCYHCHVPSTFYNRYSCECEFFRTTCTSIGIFQSNRYYNKKTCTSDCLPRCCPRGHVHNKNTCAC